MTAPIKDIKNVPPKGYITPEQDQPGIPIISPEDYNKYIEEGYIK